MTTANQPEFLSDKFPPGALVQYVPPWAEVGHDGRRLGFSGKSLGKMEGGRLVIALPFGGPTTVDKSWIVNAPTTGGAA